MRARPFGVECFQMRDQHTELGAPIADVVFVG